MGSAQQYKDLEDSVLIDLLADYTEKCTRTLAGGYPLPNREAYLQVVAILTNEIASRKAMSLSTNPYRQNLSTDIDARLIN